MKSEVEPCSGSAYGRVISDELDRMDSIQSLIRTSVDAADGPT
jgi:hypothetical protein